MKKKTYIYQLVAMLLTLSVNSAYIPYWYSRVDEEIDAAKQQRDSKLNLK
jgi:hypothetical protein